jgi:hypothetical protein
MPPRLMAVVENRVSRDKCIIIPSKDPPRRTSLLRSDKHSCGAYVLTPRMSLCRNNWSQFKSFSCRFKTRAAMTRCAGWFEPEALLQVLITSTTSRTGARGFRFCRSVALYSDAPALVVGHKFVRAVFCQHPRTTSLKGPRQIRGGIRQI